MANGLPLLLLWRTGCGDSSRRWPDRSCHAGHCRVYFPAAGVRGSAPPCGSADVCFGTSKLQELASLFCLPTVFMVIARPGVRATIVDLTESTFDPDRTGAVIFYYGRNYGRGYNLAKNFAHPRSVWTRRNCPRRPWIFRPVRIRREHVSHRFAVGHTTRGLGGIRLFGAGAGDSFLRLLC